MRIVPRNETPSHSGNQRDEILELLRERGSQGITNFELYRNVCLRPPSRICELRQLGFEIKTIRESEQIFRYVLLSEPKTSRPLSEPRVNRQRSLFDVAVL